MLSNRINYQRIKTFLSFIFRQSRTLKIMRPSHRLLRDSAPLRSSPRGSLKPFLTSSFHPSLGLNTRRLPIKTASVRRRLHDSNVPSHHSSIGALTASSSRGQFMRLQPFSSCADPKTFLIIFRLNMCNFSSSLFVIPFSPTQ